MKCNIKQTCILNINNKIVVNLLAQYNVTGLSNFILETFIEKNYNKYSIVLNELITIKLHVVILLFNKRKKY